jgi:hypothetical protein
MSRKRRELRIEDEEESIQFCWLCVVLFSPTNNHHHHHHLKLNNKFFYKETYKQDANPNLAELIVHFSSIESQLFHSISTFWILILF